MGAPPSVSIEQPRQVSDLDLIAAAQQGDRRAYGALVERYQEAVVGVVYSMLAARAPGDLQLAEEAAQEAFLRAWLKLASYRPEFPFRSWVYRIAMNAAIDVLRREKPTAELDDRHQSVKAAKPPPRHDPEAAVERKESAEAIHRAVMGLPPASRAAFILREYAGYSYAEIGDALDIPLGTVMSRLSFARRKLREDLAELMEE